MVQKVPRLYQNVTKRLVRFGDSKEVREEFREHLEDVIKNFCIWTRKFDNTGNVKNVKKRRTHWRKTNHFLKIKRCILRKKEINSSSDLLARHQLPKGSAADWSTWFLKVTNKSEFQKNTVAELLTSKLLSELKKDSAELEPNRMINCCDLTNEALTYAIHNQFYESLSKTTDLSIGDTQLKRIKSKWQTQKQDQANVQKNRIPNVLTSRYGSVCEGQKANQQQTLIFGSDLRIKTVTYWKKIHWKTEQFAFSPKKKLSRSLAQLPIEIKQPQQATWFSL